MKAVRWYGKEDVRVEDVPRPDLVDPTDALLKVELAAICGSDLHPYRGHITNFEVGTILGHEFLGVVEEVGEQVQRFKPGDRVLASDLVACGQCWYCRRGLYAQCRHSALFGYSGVYPRLDGGQAEYVRVPFADITLRPIPPGLTDEQVLFAGDILPTSYVCAKNGDIQPGDTVAVIGCGPVGVLAQKMASVLGAERVFALDTRRERLERAAQWGSIPVAVDQAQRVIREATEGRGADVVLEAVGSEAALELAFKLVRRKGTISVVGVHLEGQFPFPSVLAFEKELTVRFSKGDAIAYGGEVLDLVARGQIHPEEIVSHRLRLEEAPWGYRWFDRKEAFKVIMRP